MIGSNFVSLDHLITCKLHFDTPIVVIGRYINNYTLECDMPPPPVTPSPGQELRIIVEVSLNAGIQYTFDGLIFTYRLRDMMSYMYPARGFTNGNTYLTIGYQYFYDRYSIRQMCRFETSDGSKTFDTRIVSFDS